MECTSKCHRNHTLAVLAMIKLLSCLLELGGVHHVMYEMYVNSHTAWYSIMQISKKYGRSWVLIKIWLKIKYICIELLSVSVWSRTFGQNLPGLSVNNFSVYVKCPNKGTDSATEMILTDCHYTALQGIFIVLSLPCEGLCIPAMKLIIN